MRPGSGPAESRTVRPGFRPARSARSGFGPAESGVAGPGFDVAGSGLEPAESRLGADDPARSDFGQSGPGAMSPDHGPADSGTAGSGFGAGSFGSAEPGVTQPQFGPAEFAAVESAATETGPSTPETLLPEPRTNRRTRRGPARRTDLPLAADLQIEEPAAVHPSLGAPASGITSGSGSRRFWPTSGAQTAEPAPAADHEHADPGARSGRSLFRRLVDLDDDIRPAPTGSGAPTDVRLLSLGLPEDGGLADDPGEPADQRGDPELDIDQDLDRAADPAREEDRSRALELGLPSADDLRTGYAADRNAEPSAHFDAVEGSDGTGAFSDFSAGSLADADETGFVPTAEAAAGADWVERYGDRVEGWVRPEYQDEPEPVAGEYWTPVPAGSYETEYGWPTPVERLPEVPPYPPATGFDVPVAIEAEPTTAVPQWPPARPDDRIELPRSWSHRNETGPAFRKPVTLRPVADLPPEPGRFDSEAAYQQESPVGHRRFEEADDRVFLGEEGLVLASNPDTHEAGRPQEPAGTRAAEVEHPAGRGPAGRVPARRGPSNDGPYAAREESLEGPIWAVPDLPEAAMPDFTWSPEEDSRRPRRPAVMIRRRRGPGGALSGDEATQALPPMELSHPDQPRARPRPRPRPGNGPPESRSTVYVSRHAAEPS
jgi:hypothetical protein